MGRGARLAVMVPAVVVLVGLAVQIGPWGMADWLYQPARNDVRAWVGQGVAPSARAWEKTREALERAVELAPANPALHEHLAMLHLTEPALQQSPRTAVRHLALAAELRPSAPFPWSTLLLARYRAGLTQPPFERMFVEMWRLWPTDPGVQVALADVGLARWDFLAAEARSAVEAAVAAGMRRNPAEMLRISQNRGRLYPACRYVQGDGRLAQSKWLKACDAGRPG